MKIIKIILITVFVLMLLVGVGIFAFLKSFDLNRYKDQIAQQAGKAISRTVMVENLNLNFSALNGVVLEVKNLRIKDDPQFSGGDFASVDSLQLEIDVLKFLASREIVFTQVMINSPRIHLARNKKGGVNLPAPTTVKAGEEAAAATTGSTTVVKVEMPALPVLTVKSIKLSNGEVSFDDQMASPALSLSVNKIDVEVNNFSLMDSFPFSLDAALASPSPNIHVQGKIKLDLAKTQVQLEDLKFQTDLEKLSLSALQSLLPQLATVGLEKMGGKIDLICPKIMADAQGLISLSMKADFSNGILAVKSLNKPLQDISFKIEGTEKQLDFQRLFARLGSGDIQGTAQIQDYLKVPRYFFDLTTKDILLEEVLPLLYADVKAEGAFSSQFKGTGDVPAGVDPLNSLKLQGGFNVKGMKLTNVNILKSVFEGISLIPGLYEKVYDSLPEEYKNKVSQNYTLFDRAEGDIQAEKGVFSLPRLDLQADVVGVQAQADIDTQLNLNSKATVSIPKILSASIVQGVEQLGGLVGRDGQIEIPLLPYNGKAANFKTMPDLEYIGKKVIVSEGKRQIEQLLEKAIGIKTSTPQEGPVSPDSPPQAAPEKSSGQKVIEGVLDNIFKQFP